MAVNDGFGVVLKRHNGSTYVTVAQLRDVNGPSMKKDRVDVTTKDSSSRWRDFLSTLRDGGEISFEIEYDPTATTHAALVDDFESDTTTQYQIAFGDGSSTSASFVGTVVAFEPQGPMEGALTANVTIAITGAVSGI